jgi:hypothetical protein
LPLLFIALDSHNGTQTPRVDDMDLDEAMESPAYINSPSSHLKRQLQRTFSFPALDFGSKYPSESLPPSPTKQVYGLCPNSSLRTLDDIDGKTLFLTLSALLEQHDDEEEVTEV